jgi:beta-glucosidase
MAAAGCIGMQNRGCIATIKHFLANSKEEGRKNGESADMSERSLQELYLYNWKPAIVHANAMAVMGAYNEVNDVQACMYKYSMSDVLRDTWGFKGIGMSDWDALLQIPGGFAECIKWGVDLEMPTGKVYTLNALGGQPDSIINMHVHRILYARATLGHLKEGWNATAYARNTAEHRAAARAGGTAGIVLAKNIGNILPLPTTGKKIFIFDNNFANDCRRGPSGSAEVHVQTCISPKTGITEFMNTLGTGRSTLVTDMNSADYIIVFVGVTGEGEGGDRGSLSVSADNDVATALAVKTAKTIVVFTGGSAAQAGNWSKADAVLIAFYPSQEQGYCLADILFGVVNPSGKLAVTFPQDASQLPNWNLSNLHLIYPSSDTAHGYFRVNKKKQTPLFNFGHGLSYTTFEYSNLQMYPLQISAGDRVHVQVTVKNTGTIAGSEVAELYLSMSKSTPALPVREQDLRGADYSGKGTWQVLTGTYGVRVGTSSQVDMQPTASSSFTVQ